MDKETTVRLVGKHILENSDELDKGQVEAEFIISELLAEIDREVLSDYAQKWLNLRTGDSFESNIDDFDEDELIEGLEDRGYNFSKQIDELRCIEFLEDSGYVVTREEELEDGLDNIDSRKLEEIQNKFIKASWQERDNMYKLIEKI